MAPDVLTAEVDSTIVLSGATWADYLRILELRGDRPAPRVAYLKGDLQLMGPSRRHEFLKSTLGRLVEAWCVEAGVDVTPYGSWTLQNEAAERGAEPDECYVLGDAEDPQHPDLAIEVVVTSGGIDKLEIYRQLGVREVWFLRDGALSLHHRRGEAFEVIERSEVLPGLDLDQLLRFVDVRPMTRAVREYRAELRQAQG